MAEGDVEGKKREVLPQGTLLSPHPHLYGAGQKRLYRSSDGK